MTELERVKAERDVLARVLYNLDAPPCLALNYECEKERICNSENAKIKCWLEFASKHYGKELARGK